MTRLLAFISLLLVAVAVLWAQESPPSLLPPQAPSGPTPMPAVLRNYFVHDLADFRIIEFRASQRASDIQKRIEKY